jgi:chemotaxis protein methyltransferase CheR
MTNNVHSFIEEKALNQLLCGVHEKYGFDFRDYARASLKRRLDAVLRTEQIPTIAELWERLREDPLAIHRFIHGISVRTTSMFRDPHFYESFRAHIAPLLQTYPFIRLWHAGCATGEEVYSLAILLKEEGLLARCRIYATDLDAIAIEQASNGIFPMRVMKEYSSNYLSAGGKYSLSNYYIAAEEHAVLSKELKENIVFAQHNLACDSSFNEFHVILCRNVLIYFNNELRDKVLNLLHDSLCNFGILALGTKESLRFTPLSSCYEQPIPGEQLYRRVF